MSTDSTILVIHDNPSRYFETLCQRFPTVHFYSACNNGEVLRCLAEISPQVLLSFHCDGISNDVQSKAAQRAGIKWIQIAGAGYDHIGDLAKIFCQVTTCAGVLSRFQAETVLGAMINLNFGFFRYQKQQQEKVYRKLPWRSLAGQKLLLLGLGNIGQAVARNARHFGMHVTAVRTRKRESPLVDAVCTPDQLEQLLPDADFVSLHLPYNSKTHHFFDERMLACMKQSAYLINTARGKIVDEQALISVLEKKEIAGAYLDVFNEEPLSGDSLLWEMENVIITPHFCDAVEDWHERFAVFFADNLSRWLDGGKLRNRIH